MIKLRVPATSANMGAGFDTLGVAVGALCLATVADIDFDGLPGSRGI